MDVDSESPPAVELGFVHEPEHLEYLHSHFYPSKMGGKPAWLSQQSLPESILCSTCSTPMTFLLQLYAPNGLVTNAFHRSLYVFFCSNSQCTDGQRPRLAIFRSQLARENPFYIFNPPDYDRPESSTVVWLVGGTLPIFFYTFFFSRSAIFHLPSCVTCADVSLRRSAPNVTRSPTAVRNISFSVGLQAVINQSVVRQMVLLRGKCCRRVCFLNFNCRLRRSSCRLRNRVKISMTP